jgi:hypothetical protein
MSNAPVKKFRIGLVVATVWKNETDGGKPFYTVNFQRQYKNSAGEWQAGDNYNHDDLLNMAKVAERAESYIAEQ